MNKALMAAIGGSLVIYGAFWAWGLHRENQTTHQSTIASESHGEAIAHAHQAQAIDPKIADAAKAIKDKDQTIKRLRAELAEMRKPALPDTPDPSPVDLASVVVKQDELIQAQGTQIQALEVQVLNLTTSRDHWKGAYEAESRARISEGLAKDAALSNAKAQRWQGRLEGFAVGFAGGYVAGRF